jgi:DNA-binding LacI/PurR family transcriptional regulator
LRVRALLWGSPSGAALEGRARGSYAVGIERQVSGVFLAPLELSDEQDDVNRRIAHALDEARIPVVLLDRTVVPYPQRGHHDLVGIDNRRAGYVITEHLLRLGCRRIAFVGLPKAAATVDAREAGYREALYAWDAPVDRAFVHRFDPADAADVQAMMDSTSPIPSRERSDRRARHADAPRPQHRHPRDASSGSTIWI